MLKLISKGVGAATTGGNTRANTYLHLGGTEWGSGANGQVFDWIWIY